MIILFNILNRIEKGIDYIRPLGLVSVVLIIILDIFIVYILDLIVVNKFIVHALSFGSTYELVFNLAVFIIEFIIALVSLFIIEKLTTKKCPDINYKSNKYKNDYFFIIFLIFGFRFFYEGTLSQVQNYSMGLASIDFRFNNFLHTILYAPIIEELLYRGIILNGLIKKLPPMLAICLSSFIFACMHSEIFQGINAFFLALIFGYIFYRTRSIFLCIFAHFLNNLIATFILSYMFSSTFETIIYILFNLFIGAFAIIFAFKGLNLKNRVKNIESESIEVNFFIK